MEPRQFVLDNLKPVIAGVVAFVIAANLWPFHGFGIVPVAVGVGAFFLAKKFVR